VVSEDWLNVVLREVDELWNGVGLGPVNDSLSSGGSSVANWGVIESSGESDTWGGGSNLIGTRSVGSVNESVLLRD